MKLFLSRYIILLVYIPFFFLSVVTLLGSLAERFDVQKLLGSFLFLEGVAVLAVFCLLVIEWLIEKRLKLVTSATWWFILKYILAGFSALWFHQYLLESFVSHMAAPASMYLGSLFQITVLTILFGAFRLILKRNREKLQLQNNFKDAQYAALKSKLNPHFLFNTLNLISSEIEYNPQNAVILVDELSDLLRNILVLSSRKLICVHQEIEIIKNYLNLQKKRFEDRLEFSIEVEKDVLELQVPPLILQPFVENAIIHGFSDKTDTGKIDIKVSLKDRSLLIELKDNGKGFLVKETEAGHGISIVKETLELLYGKKQSLEVESSPGKGTKLQIMIPSQVPEYA